MELYVSTQGRDTWSGRLPEPAADGHDGPLASISGTRDRLRRIREGRYNPRWGHVDERLDGAVTVYVRGGVYPVTAPIQFSAADSYPVTFRAYAD